MHSSNRFSISSLCHFVCNSENWKFVEKVKERKENVSQLSLARFVGKFNRYERRGGGLSWRRIFSCTFSWRRCCLLLLLLLLFAGRALPRTHSEIRLRFVVVMWQTNRFLRYPKGQGRTHGYDNGVFFVSRFFSFFLIFLSKCAATIY